MSDAFNKVIDRLKGRAETLDNLHERYHGDYQNNWLSDEPPELWVRLKDIEETIEEIKQDYIMVSKEWLKKRLEEEWQRTRLIDASDLPQAVGKIDLILEILQRGSRGVVEE